MSSEYIQMEFSQRLKKVRMDLSISQKEMAEKLSIAISTYQYYERGEREAPVSVVCRLAAFGVNGNWLLTGKGEPYLPPESKTDFKPKEAQTHPEFSSEISAIGNAEIIQQFSDKTYAKDLNSRLVELERLNSDAFRKVGIYIKGLLDGLRMAPSKNKKYNGPERRIAERRVKGNSKKYKGAKDRRSGKDRRVAFQE